MSERLQRAFDGSGGLKASAYRGLEHALERDRKRTKKHPFGHKPPSTRFLTAALTSAVEAGDRRGKNISHSRQALTIFSHRRKSADINPLSPTYKMVTKLSQRYPDRILCPFNPESNSRSCQVSLKVLPRQILFSGDTENTTMAMSHFFLGGIYNNNCHILRHLASHLIGGDPSDPLNIFYATSRRNGNPADDSHPFEMAPWQNEVAFSQFGLRYHEVGEIFRQREGGDSRFFWRHPSREVPILFARVEEANGLGLDLSYLPTPAETHYRFFAEGIGRPVPPRGNIQVSWQGNKTISTGRIIEFLTQAIASSANQTVTSPHVNRWENRPIRVHSARFSF